ncbi:hypothetical protein ACVME8_007619 [Bradyrhizobium diazoefficiens]
MHGLSRHREEKALASKLDQLRAMTTVVADTGDLGAVARLKPVDCTTNPTIVLKAIDNPEYRNTVEEALTWGRKRSGDAARVAAATADRLAVSVGVELLRLVPGFVSTEVDANLSFNIGALVARARQIIDAYKQRGVGPDRLLIKLASTWEGIRAAEILQSEGVKCNMTLLLNRAQAIASAEDRSVSAPVSACARSESSGSTAETSNTAINRPSTPKIGAPEQLKLMCLDLKCWLLWTVTGRSSMMQVPMPLVPSNSSDHTPPSQVPQYLNSLARISSPRCATTTPELSQSKMA